VIGDKESFSPRKRGGAFRKEPSDGYASQTPYYPFKATFAIILISFRWLLGKIVELKDLTRLSVSRGRMAKDASKSPFSGDFC
jgi:hypothetical protein